MGKWVAGIAATVVAAVLISWLTGAGGLFNRKRPEVKILAAETECALPPPDSSALVRIATEDIVVASVSVVNEGSASAAQCQVRWTGISGLLGPGSEAKSPEFGLTAGESKTVAIRGYTPLGPQSRLDTALAVSCGNASSPPRPKSFYGC